jgi:hypothetical protein
MWKYWAEEQVTDGKFVRLDWFVGFDNGRFTEIPVEAMSDPWDAKALVSYLNGGGWRECEASI